MNPETEKLLHEKLVREEKLRKLTFAAMMTALVFVSNYLRIVLPIAVGGVTAFTLANIMCTLSGLMLGPWWGLAAAGLGSALYDLTNPVYAVEAPITFFTKGTYGLVAGLVLYYVFVKQLKQERSGYLPMVASALCAAVAFLAIYSVKVYFYNGMLVQGFTEPVQCWALIVAKLPATLVNGALAVIFAPILGVALHKALKAAHLEINPA
ncbi:MAG: ECF transporter S component [Clostridiales bacterium]|nr:ECF transporter S component [Clostridiales bacterium]